LIKNLFVVVLVIIVFDTVAALVSRRFQIDYSSLSLLSNLINIALGCWGASQHGLKFGVLFGTLAGFVDSTIGWLISAQIEPFYIDTRTTITFTSALMVIVIVTAQGAVCGAVGAIIYKLLDREK